ncbi:MAG: ABC-type branched-chain amino acid transport system, periplasmic component [Cenarchaeum symbiont of Oopsacas minuta]|nr:ABC-type branched-chain amino acid transport system, periplasmic component [Cenarchaeum symbiont of Oopsacas minuta]
MKSKPVIILITLAITVSIVVGLLTMFETKPSTMQPNDATSDLQAIKIGMILPLTGDFSSYGSESREAALYGIKEFNKYLVSIDQNWYLDPVIEDTATNPVQALEKIQNLRAKNIELVLGYTSGSTNAVRSYVDSNNMMVFSAASTAPSLAIPNDHIFRLVSDDRQQAKALVALLKNQGIDVAVTVWRSDTYGDGLSENFKINFEQAGGIADEGIRYNQESQEFSVSVDILNKRISSLIEEHGAEKVGIVFIGFAEAVQFMQSASQYDALKSTRWFGSDSLSQEHKLVDDPITSKFIEDVSFTTVIAGFESTPISDMLEKHLLETLGKTPTTFAKTAYDIVWLYGMSIIESDSDRSADVLPIIHNVASKYSGAIGPIILNENGDLVSSDYSIHTVSDGEWIYTGTYQKDGTIVLETTQTMIMEPLQKASLSGSVTIGLLSPISGALSAYGEETRASFMYGVETFNEYLKSIDEDWYIDIIFEDTETIPVKALEKIQNLKTQDIQLVMGSTTSASTDGIREYVDDNDMLMFACCSSAPSLAIKGDNILTFTR